MIRWYSAPLSRRSDLAVTGHLSKARATVEHRDKLRSSEVDPASSASSPCSTASTTSPLLISAIRSAPTPPSRSAKLSRKPLSVLSRRIVEAQLLELIEPPIPQRGRELRSAPGAEADRGTRH